MDWLDIHRGETPLIVSLPHTGMEIPPDIEARLVSRSLALRDTDWWIDRLYAFSRELGATVIRTRLSRTVIDVNRDPSGASLYPGQATTGLCPSTSFDGRPLYREGEEPDEAEVAARRAAFFDPYHAALSAELARLSNGGRPVVLYDCHSIRSRVPRLFEGELPVFNIGTNDGRSADPAVQSIVEAHCTRSPFPTVSNGRFKGGWITRGRGAPDAGVHAVQMEIACRGYMDESEEDAPAPFDPARAAPISAVLEPLLTALRDWASARQ